MRVAFVTGASSGIGRACAEGLAHAGFRVYGTSRRAPAAAERREGGGDRGGGGSCELLRMDVTDEESVRDAVAWVDRHERRLDVVVNNAGLSLAGAVEDTEPAEASRQMDVNFHGAARVCRLVLPRLRAQGFGCIVNMSSMAGSIAIPYQSFYSASKFALEGFSAALREEVRPWGVRVVVIRPGDHRTALTDNRARVAAWDSSPYRRECERAVRVMERDEREGPDPAGVARLVVDVARGRRRGDAYPVAGVGQRLFFGLRRFLPERGVAWGVRRVYGLGSTGR